MKLSVIVPGYNTPNAWWERCLKSVLAALPEGGEVVCVDDGSKMRPEVSVRDSRIKWIYLEQNGGQSKARNIALQSAQGEYVTFVDSDDEVLPLIYKRCISAIKEYSCDVVVFGVRGVWVKDNVTRFDSPCAEKLGALSAASMKKLFDKRLFEYPVNKLYRRAFLEENKIEFPTAICPGEDTIFNIRCALAGATWCTIPYIGYLYYRMDGTSLSRYMPNRVNAYQLKAELWREFAEKVGDPTGVMSELTRWSRKDEFYWEWEQNMWRHGSPYALKDKWRFLKSYRDVCGNPFRVMVCMILKNFIRRRLYFSWVYKWHLRQHIFKDLQPLNKVDWRAE